MELHPTQTNLPVLLLYNLDPSWESQEVEAVQKAAQELCTALQGEGHAVTQACLESEDLSSILSHYDPAEFLVFNWCEEIPGIPRSSAHVAQILEKFCYTFTGADSKALAYSQDKGRVKRGLRQQGVPTPHWRICHAAHPDHWNHFPAIVKPAWEHCSFGITREAVVTDHQELAERIHYVLHAFRQPVLVEEFIDGREFHVTVLGDGVLHVLPAAEMDYSAFADVKDRLCTFASKFDPASEAYQKIELRLPAILQEEERNCLERTVLAAYRASLCRDYARLDVRLRNGIFYVLDINPNADISPDTSVALAAEAAGLSYGRLGSFLISLATRRHPRWRA